MRLFLFDVDSTLINEEVIELIAAHAGVDKEVAHLTERAMAGELDFAASLKERVALLHGISTVALFDVSKKVTLTNGAVELIAAIQDAGDVAAVGRPDARRALHRRPAIGRDAVARRHRPGSAAASASARRCSRRHFGWRLAGNDPDQAVSP